MKINSKVKKFIDKSKQDVRYDFKKNYYEILEVDYTADKEVLLKAYDRLKNIYVLNISSKLLMTSQESRAFLQEIEEAYQVLSDVHIRLRYDKEYFKRGFGSSSNKNQLSEEQNNKKLEKEEVKFKQEIIDEKKESIFKSIENLIVLGDPSDGQLYSEIRNLQKISLEEVQSAIKVSVSHIINIEKNRYDILPHTIYVKGFLKSYLSFLNIPCFEKLVEAYCKKLDEQRRKKI